MTTQESFRLIVTYSKQGPARFISFNYLPKIIERAFRRTSLPVLFSSGFTPRIRISFGSALPVGFEGISESFFITLKEPVNLTGIKEELNSLLPPGISILSVKHDEFGKKSPEQSLYYSFTIQGFQRAPENFPDGWEVLFRSQEKIVLQTDISRHPQKMLFDLFGTEAIITRTPASHLTLGE